MHRTSAPSILRAPPVPGSGAPVDYVVVGLPRGARDFPPEFARELASLVDAEMVRVVDMVILDRDGHGRLTVHEPDELGERDALRTVESDLEPVLSRGDLVELAALVEPGRSAAVVVWEQTWAAPLAHSACTSGGRLLGSGRLSPALTERASSRHDVPVPPNR